jgi:DNA replication protein DnaC
MGRFYKSWDEPSSSLSHVPERYKDASWDEIPKEIKDRVSAAITQKRGVYLYGKVGCGKKYLDYAFSKHYNQQTHRSVNFWNMTELINELKLDMDRREKEFIGEDMLQDTRLLLLDDIGAERMTEWVQETIYLLVNHRYENMQPIIFTSNLAPSELAERVGDRIMSRIIEMCDVIKLEGDDRRLPN